MTHGMHLGQGHGHGFGHMHGFHIHGPGCKCGKHGHGAMRFFPFVLLIPLTMAASAVVGILLTARLVKALETMAMTKALDDMEGHLSDGERADLEMRIRENLFE